MNGYAVAGVAVGLWWLTRPRRRVNKPGCGCARGILKAAEPHQGTDCGANWWQRLHGADLIHPQYGNYAGVSPDPSSATKAVLAGELPLSWNGDVRA